MNSLHISSLAAKLKSNGPLICKNQISQISSTVDYSMPKSIVRTIAALKAAIIEVIQMITQKKSACVVNTFSRYIQQCFWLKDGEQ